MEAKPIAQLLQAANLVPQLKESRQLRTSELVELDIAILSPAIAECSMEEIKQVLRLVMIKVGLRGQNFPHDEEKLVLIEHIVKNFGGNRIEEIKLAFEMAMAGKLELKTDEINCYENFSCAYFSRIMNAYRGWSSQAFKQLKTEPPPPIKIYSDQETEDLYRGDIEAFYQRLRNGRVPHALPDYFKPILVKDGLMGKEEKLADFFTNRLGKGIENIYVPVKETEE